LSAIAGLLVFASNSIYLGNVYLPDLRQMLTKMAAYGIFDANNVDFKVLRCGTLV